MSRCDNVITDASWRGSDAMGEVLPAGSAAGATRLAEIAGPPAPAAEAPS